MGDIEQTVKKKPNLLFIFTDQQRADSLGCYGNDIAITPNLNRLAAESLVFENAYVTQPTCTPSRASIMTGRFPHGNGCLKNNDRLPAAMPTIGEMVSEDYVRGYYGKWHLGDEVAAQHGFEDWVSIEDDYREHYSDPDLLNYMSDYHHFLLENGQQPDRECEGVEIFSRPKAAAFPAELTKARFLGRKAVDFLNKHVDDPFILYVGFLEPHPPYISPLSDHYDPEALPVGPTFRKQPAENAALVHRMRALHYMSAGVRDGEDMTKESGCRNIRAEYMGNVTLVDQAVGEILDTLEDLGLKENTLVIYTSDHGDLLGDHGAFAKFVMYEESVRVPFMVRAPWLKHGSDFVEGRISQIDLVPTILDLLDEPIPNSLHGESKASVISGKRTLENNDVFIEWNGPNGRPGKLYPGGVPLQEWTKVRGPWRTVISADGWKLNLSRHDQCELYDLINDPHEQINLFDHSDQQERIADLTNRIGRWQSSSDDKEMLPDWIC